MKKQGGDNLGRPTMGRADGLGASGPVDGEYKVYGMSAAEYARQAQSPFVGPQHSKRKKMIIASLGVMGLLFLGYNLVQDYLFQRLEHFQLPEIAYPADPGGDHAYVSSDCWFEVPAGNSVSCGFLFTRQEKKQAGDPRIILPVMIRKAPSPGPKEKPVFFVSGGPGGAVLMERAIDRVFYWADQQPWLSNRDLIVLEQRGTGFSHPSLDCPGLRREMALAYQDRDQIEGLSARVHEIREECAQPLRQAGYYFSEFNSAATARDIFNLQKALGIEKAVLYGISAGGRVALEALRLNPDRIEALLLDSPLPTGGRVVGETLDGILPVFLKLESVCNNETDLECDADDLIAKANKIYRQPFKVVSVINPLNGHSQDVQIGKWQLLNAVQYGISYRDWRPDLVRNLMKSKVEDSGTLHWIGQIALQLNMDLSFNRGVFEVFSCMDENRIGSDLGKAGRSRGGAFLGGLSMLTREPVIYRKDCADWGIYRSRNRHEPVTSDVPVLILSGEMDLVTVPALNRAAAERLTNAVVMAFPESGHGVLFEQENPCAKTVVSDFLKRGSVKTDLACLHE